MNDSVKSLVEVSTRTINGKEVLAVTSLQVAEHFEKNHKDVLRDIRVTIEKCSSDFTGRNFALSEYEDSTGRKLPMYLLSKDGFLMVAMAYTTPEAMRIKEAYIARFNDMERELAGRNPSLPQTYADALRALAAEVEIRQAVEQQKALAESQRECLTRMPVFGILNVPNRTGVAVALAWPHQVVKSGLFCSCHRYTSSGCGHILARRRPGVREAPAAVRAGERRLAFFCAQNPKSY
jgi:Rha family phage regulatory protein